jgi:glucokinase
MKYIVGVDIGGTNIKIALLDTKMRIRAKRIFPTAGARGKNALIDSIVEHVEFLLSENNIGKKSSLGVGIGAPGAVNVRTGIVHYFVNIPDWREVPLGPIMRRRLKVPVFVDNDVNVMALAEFRFGAGRGSQNMLGIALGTGVGGGLVLEGRLYRGTAYAGGEFGHLQLSFKGPKCKCGSHGCLEAYSGSHYIANAVAAAIRAGERTYIKELVGGDLSKITPEVIDKAARAGDGFAKSVWHGVGEAVGMGIAGVANLLNVDKVVIGGGVARAGRILFDAIRRTVDERAMELPAKTVKIVKAKLGYDAGVIGAGALVLYELSSSLRGPKGRSNPKERHS